MRRLGVIIKLANMKFIALTLLPFCSLFGQQVADTAFQFQSAKPRYAQGRGSVVQLDAAHNNFHTLDGRYAPFAKVLRQDGFNVISNGAALTEASLAKGKIFVISNPLDSSNVGRWQLPIPSAFSPSEMKALNHWVKNGGRLLLIADHMPFAGAAADLARSFGFEYLNCFAVDNRQRSVERFFKENQSLLDNEITRGIDTIVTFTGSAFRIPKAAKGILALHKYTLLSPKVAWQFEESTPATDSKGYYQGAYMPYGKGKIVVMGEAAMFSAQLTGPNRAPVGMNNPNARENAQLLLNILRWLDE
jgi:hypothetical protein